MANSSELIREVHLLLFSRRGFLPSTESEKKWEESRAPLAASSHLLTDPPSVKAWWSKPQLTWLHVCPWAPGRSYRVSGRTGKAGNHLSICLTLLSFSVQWPNKNRKCQCRKNWSVSLERKHRFECGPRSMMKASQRSVSETLMWQSYQF